MQKDHIMRDGIVCSFEGSAVQKLGGVSAAAGEAAGEA